MNINVVANNATTQSRTETKLAGIVGNLQTTETNKQTMCDQNKRQTKKLEMGADEDVADRQSSGSDWRCGCLPRYIDDVDHTFAGEPQEEGMMQQSSSFP